jgi:hypothetical protein
MKRPSTVLAVVGVSPWLTSRGSIPLRFAPEQGLAPMHTGTKSRAAWAALNSSGRKFDAWRVESHCGVIQ